METPYSRDFSGVPNHRSSVSLLYAGLAELLSQLRQVLQSVSYC